MVDQNNICLIGTVTTRPIRISLRKGWGVRFTLKTLTEVENFPNGKILQPALHHVVLVGKQSVRAYISFEPGQRISLTGILDTVSMRYDVRQPFTNHYLLIAHLVQTLRNPIPLKHEPQREQDHGPGTPPVGSRSTPVPERWPDPGSAGGWNDGLEKRAATGDGARVSVTFGKRSGKREDVLRYLENHPAYADKVLERYRPEDRK